MDKCSSLFQCGQRLLVSWRARESDLLDCDRCRRSVGHCLVKAKFALSEMVVSEMGIAFPTPTPLPESCKAAFSAYSYPGKNEHAVGGGKS